MDAVTWDLWVDYHRTDGAGLSHVHVRNVEPGVALDPGKYLVVGNGGARVPVWPGTVTHAERSLATRVDRDSALRRVAQENDNPGGVSLAGRGHRGVHK